MLGPAAGLRDSLEGKPPAALPPRLRPGLELDGLLVEEVLHDARATLISIGYAIRAMASSWCSRPAATRTWSAMPAGAQC